MIGMLLIVALPYTERYSVGRLIGFYMTQANPATGASVLSLISSNVAGYTKKSTVAGLYLVGYCVGNLIGPYTFSPDAAPRYVSAQITILVCYSLCIVDLLFIRWWYVRENKRKAEARNATGYQRLQNAA
jgi:MFS transporter, ACS family, allantoate permease